MTTRSSGWGDGDRGREARYDAAGSKLRGIPEEERPPRKRASFSLSSTQVGSPISALAEQGVVSIQRRRCSGGGGRPQYVTI